MSEPSTNEVDLVIGGFVIGIFLMPGLIIIGLLAESASLVFAFFALSPFWVWIIRRPAKWREDAVGQSGLASIDLV